MMFIENLLFAASSMGVLDVWNVTFSASHVSSGVSDNATETSQR